jgi:CyaY protein
MTVSDHDRIFIHRTDALVNALVARFDECDPDELEAELSQGVLKLTFGDGARCILNRQSAAQQMWLAEGATAWHFTFDAAAAQWLDTKGRGSLGKVLTTIVERKLGRPFPLALA